MACSLPRYAAGGYTWSIAIQNIIISPTSSVAGLANSAAMSEPVARRDFVDAFCAKGGCSGLPDSGNPGITLPTDVFDRFIAATGTTFPHGAAYAGFTQIACPSGANAYNSLPSLTFQLNYGLYTLEPADYIEQVRFLLLLSKTLNTFVTHTGNGAYCWYLASSNTDY